MIMNNALFKELEESNEIFNAQIVGKNIFCNNPDSKDAFCLYFDFCIKVAKYPIDINERSFFVKEAELALTVFSEKANLDKDVLTLIQEKQNDLDSVIKEVNSKIDEQEQLIVEKEKTNNDRVLVELAKLKGSMSMADTESKFQEVLGEMSKQENLLNKSLLSDEQTVLYNTLTRDFSNLVSVTMAKIAHIDDVAYNKKVAESIKTAFDLFKCDEDKYVKSDRKLSSLVSRYLFAFDAKRLFSETLVYFNHVYSYIFNKLDDDGKYRFTQLSFDTPKM